MYLIDVILQVENPHWNEAGFPANTVIGHDCENSMNKLHIKNTSRSNGIRKVLYCQSTHKQAL